MNIYHVFKRNALNGWGKLYLFFFYFGYGIFYFFFHLLTGGRTEVNTEYSPHFSLSYNIYVSLTVIALAGSLII